MNKSQESQPQKQRSSLLGFSGRALRGVNDFVKSRDLYGAPVSLNYKGDDTFKTCPGGLLSILLLFLVGAYAFIKGKYMVDMEEWQLIQ